MRADTHAARRHMCAITPQACGMRSCSRWCGPCLTASSCDTCVLQGGRPAACVNPAAGRVAGCV